MRLSFPVTVFQIHAFRMRLLLRQRCGGILSISARKGSCAKNGRELTTAAMHSGHIPF